MIRTSGIDAMLVGNYLPKLGTDLVATLSGLDVYDFPHFSIDFETGDGAKRSRMHLLCNREDGPAVGSSRTRLQTRGSSTRRYREHVQDVTRVNRNRRLFVSPWRRGTRRTANEFTTRFFAIPSRAASRVSGSGYHCNTAGDTIESYVGIPCSKRLSRSRAREGRR